MMASSSGYLASLAKVSLIVRAALSSGCRLSGCGAGDGRDKA